MATKPLADFIKEKKFHFPADFSGGLQRFDRNGKENAGWAVGNVYNCAGKEVQCVRFGDWSTGESYEWWSGRHQLTAAERAEMDAAMKEHRASYVKEKEERQGKAALLCWSVWEQLVDGEPSRYSLRKGLYELYGARRPAKPMTVDLGVGRRKDGTIGRREWRCQPGDLIVPMVNAAGELRNLQKILPEKPEKGLDKFMFPGAEINGCFHTIGEISPEGVIYVCEGYATGASIFEALNMAAPSSPAAIGSEEGAGRGDGGAAVDGERRAPGQARQHDPIPQPGMVPVDQSQRSSLDEEVSELGDLDRLDRYLRHDRKPGEDARRLDLDVGEVHQGGADEDEGRLLGARGRRDRKHGLSHDAGPLEAPGRSALRVDRDTDERAAGDSRATPHASRAVLALARQAGGRLLPGELGREEEGAVDDARREHREAHGGAVVIAFNAGNLTAVAGAIRKLYPSSKIIVAGDDDRWSVDPHGKKINPGRKAALDAARLARGRLVLPYFRDLPDVDARRPTDFNDMACLVGLEATFAALTAYLDDYPRIEKHDPHLPVYEGNGSGVTGQPYPEPLLEAAWGVVSKLAGVPGPGVRTVGDMMTEHKARVARGEEAYPALSSIAVMASSTSEAMNLLAQAHGSGSGGNAHQAEPSRGGPVFEPLVTYSKNGGVQLPPPQLIVEKMLEVYEGRLVKFGKDIFSYTGTHWKMLGVHERDTLMQQIQMLCGGEASAGSLENLLEAMRIHLPPVPEGRDLYAPNPYAANFLNGTLHAERAPDRSWQLVFRKHAASDYLINVLPYDYKPEDELAPNAEFETMLNRVFESDPDAEDKRRALAQMYGACLMPIYPHLFMLFGQPGTGKSTAIKLAARLAHEDNVSRVDPSEFEGFNLESMAGKLINVDTDIDVSRPIRDSIVKKIEDRQPFRIRRKNIKDIYAPLPAVHIFGGNAVPPTLEGTSRAHDRRWTFLGFNRSMTTSADYDKDYDAWCFEQGPEGVLRFALSGLRDLLARRGHFTSPQSGKDEMEHWQLGNDPVGRFIAEVQAGEVFDGNTQVSMGFDAKIERKKLYEVFKIWSEEGAPSQRVMNSHRFYRRIEEAGYPLVMVRGKRFVKGFCLGVGGDALA